MAKTQGEKLEDLAHKLHEIDVTLAASRMELKQSKELIQQLDSTIDDLSKQIAKQNERIAVIEQRCAALEKGTDRTWQFITLGIAVVSLIVTLIVALAKKSS